MSGQFIRIRDMFCNGIFGDSHGFWDPMHRSYENLCYVYPYRMCVDFFATGSLLA